MGVSHNGFYDWLGREDRAVDPQRQELQRHVRQLAAESKHTYGSRRMAKGLQSLGYAVGRCKARNLMREAGVVVRYRRRYRVTTNSDHRQPVFPNRLERAFTVSAPNRVWVSDISYLWTRSIATGAEP